MNPYCVDGAGGVGSEGDFPKDADTGGPCLTHPLGLLELLQKLLQGRGVPLPHVLDLSFVVPRLFFQSLLQLSHLLFALGAGQTYF